MARFIRVIAVVAAVLLASCQTLPDEPLMLEDALKANVAITLPMRVSEKGLLVLEKSLDRAGLKFTAQEERMIHGMIESQNRRIVTLPQVTIGPLQYTQKQVIVLDNPKSGFAETENYDGLIGMDILSDYNLLISPSSQELKLIPRVREIYVPGYWSRIELTQNPFLADGRNLHFLQLRIAGRRTPALLDTGSEFSLLNWSAARFSQVKLIRRRLERDWQMQGAVGVFKPQTKIRLRHFRGGQKFWDDKDFIVMDFESLDILGVADQPFIQNLGAEVLV